jgi:Papain family cysteine protease
MSRHSSWVSSFARSVFTIAVPVIATLACSRRTGGQTSGGETTSNVPIASLRLPDLPVDVLPPLTEIPGDMTSALRVARGVVCGYAEVNGRYHPLDCLSALSEPLRWASRVVVARTLVSDSVGESDVIDPRGTGTLGPVRDQGRVGSCTAFSLATAIDRELRRDGIPGVPVSTMLLWSRYHVPQMRRAATANTSRVIAPESAWPYNDSLACAWDTDPGCECSSGCGLPVDREQQQRAEEQAIAELVDVESVDSTAEALRHALARGRSVWFSMAITRQFQNVRGANAVVPDFDGRSSPAGHAMTLAGYKSQQDGVWFLIQNSWGTDWGDNGFAWIHQRTLLSNLAGRGCFVVAVRAARSRPQPSPSEPTPEAPTQPVRPAPVRPQPTPVAPAPPAPVDDPVQLLPSILGGFARDVQSIDPLLGVLVPVAPTTPGACPARQVPDALVGGCRAPCPDGSPPVLGQCVSSGRCPASSVDLGGRCFRASPQRSLTRDVPSGVTYRCGPGGCSYWLPQGTLQCRRPGGCTVSCATPRSVLVASPRGIGCSF